MNKKGSLAAAIIASLAIVLALSCVFQKDDAKTRVENVLYGMTKDDQSNEYQTAICQWFDGSYTMGASDLEAALNQFEAWQREKSIKVPIATYTVGKVTIEKNALISTSLVDVTINGRALTIKVTKGEQLEWASPAH